MIDLFNKRVILVSGKGGTGKTTISVLLALYAASQKKRTLVVEMNSSGRVPAIFNTSGKPQEEIPLAPYISSINLSPRKCFEEYVLKRIRFKSIYRAFFNNTFVSNFLDAVPGLNDILMLGKIYELEKQYKSKALSQLSYDLIIVDTPATGHTLSTLEVPRVIQSAIKIGPLHNHATNILDLLAQQYKTAFCLVTLAEEMPVSESREYIDALKNRTRLNFGPLFVNAVMPDQAPISAPKKPLKELKVLWHYHDLAVKRSRLNKHYIEKIHDLFSDLERIIIPFQFHDLKESRDFKSLIKHLEEVLA